MKMTVFLGLKIDPALAAQIDEALAKRKADGDPHAISKSAFLRHLIDAGLFLLQDGPAAPPAEAAPPVAVLVERQPDAPPPMALLIDDLPHALPPLTQSPLALAFGRVTEDLQRQARAKIQARLAELKGGQP
jgi:hypothetical protein